MARALGGRDDDVVSCGRGGHPGGNDRTAAQARDPWAPAHAAAAARCARRADDGGVTGGGPTSTQGRDGAPRLVDQRRAGPRPAWLGLSLVRDGRRWAAAPRTPGDAARGHRAEKDLITEEDMTSAGLHAMNGVARG